MNTEKYLSVKPRKIGCKIVCLLILLVLTSSVYAQKITISGNVTDDFGDPLTGASIIEKSTTNGTVVDLDGKFTLNVAPNATLVISFLGFISQEIPIDGKTAFNIILREDAQNLEEVVIVGYGVQRKSDVTGSISVTKADDILKQQSFSALDGLKGKASGVNIFSNSGQPGGNSRIMIRGIGTVKSSSEPLYIVDGVAMEGFQHINPNDIERIEVLKDASSSAIYGARGANGVILVTTKRGGNNERITVSYSGSLSVSTMASYMDVMDADEFIQAMVISRKNANSWYEGNFETDPAKFLTDPRLFKDGKPLYNTDWQKEATRTALSHNHQLNIQQGGKNSSVGAFLNYTDQQGIMNNTYMKRLNGKLTYDAKPAKWLSTGVNILANHTWGNEGEETGGHQMPRRSMIEMVPFFPVKFPDGRWSNSSTITDDMGFEGMANPVHMLETQERMRYRTKIFGNAALTFHLAPGLDLKTQFGIDADINREKDYSPTDLKNIADPHGRAKLKDINTLYWQEETYLTYMKTLAEKHRLNLMGGLSWQQRTARYHTTEVEGFGDNILGNENIGAGTNPKEYLSNYTNWSMNSYFLRAAYTYNDKYMATLTGRIDGSSRFGENNKYGMFPSLGLGWMLSNEDFMKGISELDNLKIRTSYGITGNTEISTYQSLGMIKPENILMNGIRVASAYPERMANPNLEWEKTNQFDVGFELGLFRNRLNVDFSYYHKTTNDLLLDIPLPYHTGFKYYVGNIGQVNNQGIDLLINSVNVRTNDFEWSTTLNMNYNKNEIIALGENNEDIEPGPNWVSGSQTILRVGEALGSFWGYERLGIWTEDDFAAGLIEKKMIGQARRSDKKKILGKGTPDFTGSFINNFSYKNFDLTLDLQFVYGVDVLQQFYHSTEDRFGLTNGLSSILYDGWSPSNQNTMVQAIRNAALHNIGQSSELDSHWIADGSYIRANLIQFGYTVPAKTVKKLSLGSLRLYCSVNNAFLIKSSDFKGYDPEGSSYSYDRNDPGANQWGQNMFFFQYPKPRTFTFGLNATF